MGVKLTPSLPRPDLDCGAFSRIGLDMVARQAAVAAEWAAVEEISTAVTYLLSWAHVPQRAPCPIFPWQIPPQLPSTFTSHTEHMTWHHNQQVWHIWYIQMHQRSIISINNFIVFLFLRDHICKPLHLSSNMKHIIGMTEISSQGFEK